MKFTLAQCANLLQPMPIRMPALALAIATSGLAGTQSLAAPRPVANSVLPIIQRSKAIGQPEPSEIIHIAVSLKPGDAAGFQTFCDQVSSPTSPSYGQFLTPEQVGERFGASAKDQVAVASFLRSKGLRVTLVEPNRLAVLAEGTASRVQTAFGTQIKEYVGPSPDGGFTVGFRANATPILLPANLADSVLKVSGVENYTRPKPQVDILTPFLVRSLYGNQIPFNAGFHGEGMTIGITNFDGFLLSNAQLFIDSFHLPTPPAGPLTNISIVTIDGGSQNGQQFSEGDLDIQMQLATAPLANIIVYDGGQDLIHVLAREATDNRANVISESYIWSGDVSFETAAHNQHLAMTAQGMTYVGASGDSGTNLEPYTYPSDDPEVLMAGGSVADVDPNTGARLSEVGWSGSGGGWSNDPAPFNTLPSWQHGPGIPTNINRRLLPDFALHSAGSQGGYYFAYMGNITGGNGTSFVAPIFAGSLAVVEQRLIAAGFSQTGRLGRIQDRIYGQQGRSDVWFDILSGSNGVLPNGQTSNCTPGWDFVTGWGAPNFDAFFHTFTQQTIRPATYQITHGSYLSGQLSDLFAIDGLYLRVQSFPAPTPLLPELSVVLTATSPTSNPIDLRFLLRCHVNTPNVGEKIEMFDYQSNAWVQVATANATTSDSSLLGIAPNAGRFVQPGTNQIQTRVSYKPMGPTFSILWQAFLDQAVWQVTQ